MNELLLLIQRIESGRLLSPATFNIDLDEALDQRDQSDFDTEWVRVNNTVQSMEIPTEGQGTLDRLREAAFKKTFGTTDNSELAGYVSDDFGLLGAALLVGVDDDWLNAMWLEYWNERFPHGTLSPVEGTLREMIE